MTVECPVDERGTKLFRFLIKVLMPGTLKVGHILLGYTLSGRSQIAVHDTL